jgi:hypothetical protein
MRWPVEVWVWNCRNATVPAGSDESLELRHCTTLTIRIRKQYAWQIYSSGEQMTLQEMMETQSTHLPFWSFFDSSVIHASRSAWIICSIRCMMPVLTEDTTLLALVKRHQRKFWLAKLFKLRTKHNFVDWNSLCCCFLCLPFSLPHIIPTNVWWGIRGKWDQDHKMSSFVWCLALLHW